MKPKLLLILFVVLTSALRAEEPKTVKLILSPETTYLTEPRLPDGRIDYLAALNKELAARTTPRNNILIGAASIVAGELESPLLQAAEKGEIPKESEDSQKYRERFWKMVGLDAPPPIESLVVCSPFSTEKNYEKELLEFYTKDELKPLLDARREKEKEWYKKRLDDGKITKEDYDKELKKIETETPDWYYREIISEQWTEARKRPWTAKEFPYLAKWVSTMDPWMPKLIDVCRHRTGYYHPLISDIPTLFAARIPYVQMFRSVARLLETRGNLEFTQGQIDQAMESALTSVRMGRTMRQGSSLIVEDLIGISVAGVGNYLLTIFLADLPKEKDAAWILQKKKEYDAIETKNGSLPTPLTWVLEERLGTLSAVQLIALEPKTAHEFFNTCFKEETELLAKYEKLFNSGTEYDWNEILKQVNFFYDDLEDVCLLPNWSRRFRAAERMEKRTVEYSERNDELSEKPERRAVDFVLGNLTPSIASVMVALTRAEWETKITNVAFALAAYRADHGGENPDTLEQLVPKYMPKIPESPFTEKPLRYLKRQHDVLIVNDDEYKLDGSEPDVEKKIAEEKSGGRVYLSARHFIFIVQKTK